jgi:hypothetical protein
MAHRVARRSAAMAVAIGPTTDNDLRWSRLSEQIFRVDKWSLCQG